MSSTVSYRHLHRQLPGILGMLKAAVLSGNPLTRPRRLPSLPVHKQQRVAAMNPALIADYAAWAGAPADRYRDSVPPHFCSHWAMPLLADLGRLAPYNLLTLLNQGVRLVMHQPIPQGAPLELAGTLVDVSVEDGRLRIHTRIEASVPGLGRCLDIDSYAAVLLGKRGGGRRGAREERVWSEAGHWSAGADDGLRFALLTGDFNPIHTVPAVGRRTAFGRCILHGFGQLARTWETLRNAGIDFSELDIRWIQPLPLPTLDLAVEVTPAADAQGLLGLRLRSPDGTVHLVGTLRPAGTPGREEIRHG